MPFRTSVGRVSCPHLCEGMTVLGLVSHGVVCGSTGVVWRVARSLAVVLRVLGVGVVDRVPCGGDSGGVLPLPSDVIASWDDFE